MGDELDVRWIHGSSSAKHNRDPEIQVHAYDPGTFILRQNKAVHYEAPFLFLLFGQYRAVLIDTGATQSPDHFPLRRTVDELIAARPAGHPSGDYELLVLHTHGHSDHVAGDSQFRKRSATRVVSADRAAAWEFFGFGADPDATTRIDLGGRELECFPSPGHHEAAVTFYDSDTGLLLTGDTAYPGRLYIQDWAAFAATIDRLVTFSTAHPISHVLGCHIEMTTTPGVDYPVRTTYQPQEPPLQMTVAHLTDIQKAVQQVYGQPGRHVYADFILDARTP